MMSELLRILLLEDSPIDAELNERILRQAGIAFESMRVETRVAFVAALDTFRPDLILADYSLPGFDGRQALAIVRERSPDLPYIFVTGTMGEEQAVEAMKQGAADYILKDKLMRLPTAVRHALAEQEWQRQLRQSETINKLIVSKMPLGCITWNKEFRVESWNPGAERIFGFTEAERMGQPLYDFIVPQETRPEVDSRGKRLLESDETARRVNENLTKDGRTIICEWTDIPFKQPDGTVTGVFSMVHDITERKQAEAKIMAAQAELQELLSAANQSRQAMLSVLEDQNQAAGELRESEEKFRKITQSAQDAIIMMGPDQRIMFWNVAAERMFGHTELEATGQELHALITPPQAHARFSAAFPKFHESGEGPLIGNVTEFTALRKGGEELLIALSLSATLLNGQWHAIGIVRDITEQKQTELQLHEQLTELHRWHEATLGRELRTLELKREVNELLREAGQPPRYLSVESGETTTATC